MIFAGPVTYCQGRYLPYHLHNVYRNLPVNSHGYYNFQQAKRCSYLVRVTTTQGQPLNVCRVPEQRLLYGTYVSHVTGSPCQIARTYP